MSPVAPQNGNRAAWSHRPTAESSAEPSQPITDADRKAQRLAFVAPFEALLALVDSTRATDTYPVFTRLDPRTAEGERRFIFVANDYLGLSTDSRVRNAAIDAVARSGTSRCASPLAGGFTSAQAELESELAAFVCQEEAAVFASGYQANVGIISSLMGRGDLVITDLFDHASIIDGARLSGAQVRFFRHNDPAHLRRILTRHAKGRRTLVVVEGVYSADGDIVRLPEICAVAHELGALVMIDEAHSLGVLGENGRGAAEHHDHLREVDLVMGTLSKSLASVGGFVAGDSRLLDVIRHRARSLIFSAALTPAAVAAGLEALRILQREPERRERLWHNARALLAGLRSRGFDTMEAETPVIPIMVGDPGRTIELTVKLRSRGLLVCPAIPPMVRTSASRIRLHVTALHDDAMLAEALEILTDVGAPLGLCNPRAVGAAAGDAREGFGAA